MPAATPQVVEGQKVRINGRGYTVQTVWVKECLLSAPKTRKEPASQLVRRISTIERMLAS